MSVWFWLDLDLVVDGVAGIKIFGRITARHLNKVTGHMNAGRKLTLYILLYMSLCYILPRHNSNTNNQVAIAQICLIITLMSLSRLMMQYVATSIIMMSHEISGSV